MKKIKSIVNNKYFAIAIFIIWMLVVFFFSNQNLEQSNNTSYEIVDVVETVIDTSSKTEEEKIEIREDINYAVRKTAHFTEYAILAMLLLNVLRFYSIKQRKKIIFSVMFIIIYAMTDELHQMFSSGRSPMVKDVLIDSSGGMLGIVIFSLFNKRKK